MYCNHCGSWLPDNCKFCPNCGAQVSKAARDAYTQTPNATDRSAERHDTYAYSQVADTTDAHSDEVPSVPYSYVTPGAHTTGPLRTDRDIIIYILLSIVTCGIYGYYFIYTLAQDANIICEDDGETTPGLAVYLLLSIVTCGLYSYWWEYRLANRLKQNGRRYGVNILEGGSDVLVWLVLGLFTCGLCQYVATYILIKNMNILSDAYNHRYGYR